VESVRVGDKVLQKHIRYIGKEVDGRTVLSSSLSDVCIDEVRLYGPLIVLDYLAKDIGLHEVLGKCSAEILSMVYAHCLDYKSVQQMSRWFERTDLALILGLEGLTEARLLHAMDDLEARDTVELQKQIFERVAQRYNIDLGSTGVVYDVTNTYLYGKNCPLGKLGKDKQGVKGRPLIQIGLAVTKEEGIPILHQVFDGNIHDARTLQDILSALRRYHFSNALVVFDRGISSKKNQKDIKALRHRVLCGLPLDSALKRRLRSTIATEELVEYENRVRLNKTVFYVQTS
jgi:transposase